MPELRNLVEKVRSKNAGPFWVTIDVFCGQASVFERVSGSLATERVAALFETSPNRIKRFDIPELNTVKFSLPRPVVQGQRNDRDMHGAAWASLLAELDID